MFLLSRTGCELQRTGLLQWPSPGSMLGWESQRGEKILENCCGTGPVDVTFPALLVQEVGAGHRLQARNMLMLIYGSSRRRGICLLHIQVSHLWAITPTQVWRDAKKKYSKPLLLNFRVRDYQLPWKCHTYKKNYVHHILLEEKLSASHYTCVYPAQVRSDWLSSLILPNWIQLLTSCNFVFYWDFVLQRDLALADGS